MKIPSPLSRLYVTAYRIFALNLYIYICVCTSIYISRNITDDNRDKVGYNDFATLIDSLPQTWSAFQHIPSRFLSRDKISKILPLQRSWNLFFSTLLEFSRKEDLFLLSSKKTEGRNSFRFFRRRKTAWKPKLITGNEDDTFKWTGSNWVSHRRQGQKIYIYRERTTKESGQSIICRCEIYTHTYIYIEEISLLFC